MPIGLQRILWAGLFILCAAGRAAGVEPPPAVCRAVRADPPPAIDGRLEDAVWQAAPVYGDFTVAFRDTAQRVPDTSFQVAYDDAWIYFAADCRNPDMAALPPLVERHAWKKKQAYAEESVEIFLDPGTAGKVYLHYILYFANARDQRRCIGHSDDYIAVPWRSATAVRADGWTAELAIPLCVLAGYARAGAFRLNIARNRRVPLIDAQQVVIEESLESSVWAPALQEYAGLHETESFVPCPDVALAQPRVPLLARITDAQPRPYYLRDGQSFYALDLELQGYHDSRGALELVVADQPAAGAPREHVQAVAVTGAAPHKLLIEVPVNSLYGREARVHLRAPGQAEILDTFIVENLAALNVMQAFPDRNYYTTEACARAVCRIALPADVLRSMTLEARAADGAVLAEKAGLSADTLLEIPLAGLPSGVSRVDLVLRAAAGGEFFKAALNLVKRAPRPGREWKIDQERRVVLNNGRPFFPFGMVMSGVQPGDTNSFRELAENNFNTFFVWARTTPEGLAEFQQRAAAHDLFVISSPDGCGQKIEWECYARYSGKLLEQVKRVTEDVGLPKGVMTLPITISARNAIYGEFYNKNITNFLRGVEAVKGFPNLAAHFIMDEPMSARQFDEYKFGQDYYARIHRADGYHPVGVNYSSFIPAGDEYVNWCDILMTDPYWTPPAGADTRSTPNHVSKICRLTDRRALAHRQAVWQILAAPLWSGCRKRPLNAREIRCQTYLALIHKASGILFFAYSNVRPVNWPVFRQLGAEMKVLAPFVTGPETGIEPGYRRALLTAPGAAPQFEADPFDPDLEQYPAIQAAILADPAGNYLLLAANSRHYPVAGRFEIPGLDAVAAEFGAGRPELAGAAFTDTLEPYATRAYRITLRAPLSAGRPDPPAPPGAAPAGVPALTVSQSIQAGDLPNPESARLPFCYRPDRKNLLPNPSLEEENTETWPDYCRISQGVALQDGGALYGRKCLKFEAGAARRIELMQMQCAPQSDLPLTHTFSVYIKGSRPGLKAWIRAISLNPEKPYGENRHLELTTDWQRYAISGVMPARLRDDGNSFLEVRLNEPGVMWVDGLQLERGPAPTEFED